MSQPKLTLRPPPHREFIQGFPGIVGSNTRPPAHIAGTVEVRLGTKGLKAAWLRIELRKLETLPGGESWGELIGKGPIDVWSARKDEAHKSDSEKGWELLQTADFPFQVAIPEGLPPSAKLEKNAGIGYELVTSLCVRSKKGLLKKETTSSIIQNTHPLWLDKHELHSTWPVYSTPEDHEAIQDDMRVKVMRARTCYGPGDNIDVRVIVTSDRISPIKVKSISFSVRETITFKGGAKKAFSSNKAASQKTESLSSKSKSFGKKVYKGDTHTFDLTCQIPRTHTLMTIQTAKHIEVSYTLRVQVETAKKPIIIDHLPITVSNFAKTASDALMDRIGWVPGLSAPADSVTQDLYVQDFAAMPPSGSHSGQPAITRSISFGGSTYSGERSSYPGYAGGDLRRRDTVMTQGTVISGPGMAGRGVPGQVFSWGQYGSAQPFGSGEAPRHAFAGPPSIYEGRELAPEESRALFHSTNRPQSSALLGTAVDPVLMPTSSYHGNSGTVTPIVEGSEDGHARSRLVQHSPYQQQLQLPHTQADNRRHSHFGGGAFTSGGLAQTNGLRYSTGGAAFTDRSNFASPVDGRSPYDEQLPLRGPGTPELGTTRYVRPEPVHQPLSSQTQPSWAQARGPGADPNGAAMTSAEAEKQHLYERARQQAQRNQRRADERRALHQGTAPSTPISPDVNGGRPYSMYNLASASASPSATPAPPAVALAVAPSAAVAALSAEAEKMRLFERARAEAERYQSSYNEGAAFPAIESAANGAGSSSMLASSASQGFQSSAHGAMVSGRTAPYPSYMTAEEEKRQLYERAKAEADAYQRGEGSSDTVTASSASAQPISEHRQAASLSTGTAELPGAWPGAARAFAGATPSASTLGPATAGASSSANGQAVAGSPLAGTGAISEKEQLRRYHEARDAVSQHIQQASSSSSFSAAPQGQGNNLTQAQTDRMYAPEVASAVHHATPHQPADTVATPTRASPLSLAPVGPATVTPTTGTPTTTGVQSYLTEAEQQSAEEKERLASHYAKKAAKAEAKAFAKANGASQLVQGQREGVVQSASASAGASEKAQLAAYYAARDAMEQNLSPMQSAPAPAAVAAGSGSNAGVSSSLSTTPAHQIPALRAASPIVLPSMSSVASNGTAHGSIAGARDANQWRPKYNSLYDDSDVDHLLDGRDAKGSGGGVPPPLPPKIPLGHRSTASQGWS
ncbi:hypothetical protein EX895_002726 [Sporisorium graminicola]|uniref:Arrestin C-terminal-like domain-containing protein n=1 Tax=Sporisorium graminicola TaxID=280036 RepID=A0A4U7KUQ8_9BASI|nr:hypothetical protein EX895_002726 [Sporisorium graminicola]TKY88374.1 hypothetical protein EX895_002726 [Sporisorium graminicola]